MTSTDTERALFRAILDNPYDDTARLVYADCMEENGQAARAELIRVQVELAQLGSTTTCSECEADPSSYLDSHSRAFYLCEREKALLAANPEWSRPPCPGWNKEDDDHLPSHPLMWPAPRKGVPRIDPCPTFFTPPTPIIIGPERPRIHSWDRGWPVVECEYWEIGEEEDHDGGKVFVLSDWSLAIRDLLPLTRVVVNQRLYYPTLSEGGYWWHYPQVPFDVPEMRFTFATEEDAVFALWEVAARVIRGVS